MADEVIRYAADAVVVNEHGRVLLIQRGWDPFEGSWALPGGHVDENETARAACARELAEEAGIRVAAPGLRLVGVYDAPDRDPRGRYVSVAFLARVNGGVLAKAGDDAADAAWFDLDKLPSLAFDHDQIIREARALARTANA